MAYGIIYQSEFDNVAENRYRLEILKKDYAGDILSLVLAGVPVKHSWQTDEPKAPIKGSSLVATVLTTPPVVVNGLDTILDLENDSGVSYIILTDTDFTPEVGVAFTTEGHPNTLANDTWMPTTVESTGSRSWKVGIFDFFSFFGFVDPAPATVVGIFSIGLSAQSFYSTEDDTFKCRFYQENQLLFEGFLVQDDCNEPMVDYLHELTLSFNDNLGLLKDVALDVPIERVTLLSIIQNSLSQTGLELDTYIYSNIFETTFDTDSTFLEQTLIDARTFLNKDSFDNCYSVLTKIFEPLHLTLFQALGAWRIIRWDEIRYDTAVPFYHYDPTFSLIDTGVLSADFVTGFEQSIYPESAPTRSIFRPFKYVKETFNYKQPESLINNADLQELGTFDHQDTDGTFTYDYYGFPTDSEWVHFFPGDPKVDTSQIVVKTDIATGKEVERYVYQYKTDLGGGVGVEYNASVQFNDIQVSAGDVMDFEIRIKAANPTGGPSVVWRFNFLLLTDEGSYYAFSDWGQVFVAPNSVAPGVPGVTTVSVLAADAETYYDYKLSSLLGKPVPKFPVDGVLRIRVQGPNTTNSGQPIVDAIWKDMKLTITNYINDSTNVIGHVHNNQQTPTIKNNEDTEIFVDDSPRSTIAGTLYLENLSGVVALRTTEWYRLSNPSELLRIGEIMTLEQLFWRRVPRTKIEGTFYGLIGNVNTYNYTGLMDFYMLSSPDRYDIYVAAIPVGTVQVGDILVITGSSSNDGSYTVTGFGTGVGFPADSYLVDGPIVNDPGDNATLSVYRRGHISMLAILSNVALEGLNFIFGSLEIDYKNNNLNCTMWEIFEDGETDGDLSSVYTFTYLYDTK